MRKIDTQQFTRFMRALEHLAKEMKQLHENDVAKEIALNGSELNAIYKKYQHSVKQLEENVELYFETFDRAYMLYRQSARHKTKISAKMRKTEKRREKKKGSFKQTQREENKQRYARCLFSSLYQS